MDSKKTILILALLAMVLFMFSQVSAKDLTQTSKDVEKANEVEERGFSTWIEKLKSFKWFSPKNTESVKPTIKNPKTDSFIKKNCNKCIREFLNSIRDPQKKFCDSTSDSTSDSQKNCRDICCKNL